MGLSYEAIQDTIAKDKGIMRRMIKVRFMQQSARSGLRSGQWRIDIKAESVEELIAKATAYSKWHIAQRIGTTVYKNPTTPGTKPIDMVEVMDNIRVNILPSVRRKIRAQGGDI